jgi:spoIIIJ-associated protein
MAKRVAEQVAKNGRRQTLEPMPADERRIIHIALRDHPDVKTESTGEDPYRKVMILPKEG